MPSIFVFLSIHEAELARHYMLSSYQTPYAFVKVTTIQSSYLLHIETDHYNIGVTLHE